MPWYILQERPFWLSRVTKWMCLDIGVLVGDLSTCKVNSSIWWTAKAFLATGDKMVFEAQRIWKAISW